MSFNAHTASPDKNLISHKHYDGAGIALSKHEQRLKDKNDLVLPLDETLSMLHELVDFEVGRFLLENKGLNSYWTSYLILHGLRKDSVQPLEKWLLESAPVVRATRERFYIFQELLQEQLRDDMTIASIPCGLMDDLVSLDTSHVQNLSYVGIDYDQSSIELAKENTRSLETISVNFEEQNAWSLPYRHQFDVITSNGLNIYEPDDDKVIDLYKNFYLALKPNGVLITSFLTPPPALSPQSTWRDYNVEDALKQKALFGDIIGVAWHVFRTEEKTEEQLREAGFQDIKFIYDSQGMFPTVIAKK